MRSLSLYINKESFDKNCSCVINTRAINQKNVTNVSFNFDSDPQLCDNLILGPTPAECLDGNVVDTHTLLYRIQ